MILRTAALVLGASLVTSLCLAAPAASSAAASLQAFKGVQAQSKAGASAKLGPVLQTLYRAHAATGAQAPNAAKAAKIGRLENLLHATDGYITVDIALTEDAAAARTRFELLGLTGSVAYKNHLSGRLPIAALAAVAQRGEVLSIRPALSTARVGLTTTQGDIAQRSDLARRNLHLTGAGYKVGVLSTSFNCLRSPLIPDPKASFTTAARDKADNDLPASVQILKDLPRADCPSQGTDEGRAIMQLVHDVAPNSRLAFYTALVSQTDFAFGIGALADAGANVIVDDIIYFAEPMFQDGIIAQAVDEAKARGVAFFSSAGNDERQSYEARFHRSSQVGLSGVRHNFASKGLDTLQRITVDPGALTLLSFQWDEPFASVSGPPGSKSDVDLIFYDLTGGPVTPCDDNLEPAVCQFPGVDFNVGGDPIEIAIISNSGESSADVQIGIELFDGPAPKLMKYVWFDLAGGVIHLDEFDTQSGSTYGHTNAAGAESVGAAAWYNTVAWGSPLWGAACLPACLEVFSSAGGVPILFDTSGRRLSRPEVRTKPGITAPDGGNTSFFFARITDPRVGGGEPDRFPNFFGTSASAPHAAAIAALMFEQMKHNGKGGSGLTLPANLAPDFIFTVLRATAADISNRAGRLTPPFAIRTPQGFDFDSGFGLVDAAKALQVVQESGVSLE